MKILSLSLLLLAAAAGNRKPVPRTAVLAETSSEAAGASVSSRRTYAVRGDGSETLLNQSIHPLTGQILLESRETIFADRTIVKSSPAIKSKYTRQSDPVNFQAYVLDARRDAAARCLSNVGGEVDGGDEMVGGHKAVKIVLKNPNQPEIDMWYAPAAGCQLVQQVVKFQRPGDPGGPMVSGVSKLFLESLRLGEPDQSFFTIPPEYEEVSQAEYDRRILQAAGVSSDKNRAHR